MWHSVIRKLSVSVANTRPVPALNTCNMGTTISRGVDRAARAQLTKMLACVVRVVATPAVVFYENINTYTILRQVANDVVYPYFHTAAVIFISPLSRPVAHICVGI